jgi:hypothetical protein
MAIVGTAPAHLCGGGFSHPGRMQTLVILKRLGLFVEGEEFAFLVGGSYVRWGYTFEPVPDGTRLTESWHFLPAGIAMFHDKYGDRAEAEIAQRVEAARTGIPATLAALKRIAEG